MTISIKPTASGSTIEQDGSAILSIDASGNLTVPNNLSVTGTAPIPDALSTASGSAPSYSARAWVTFNGTGVVAIRASGNVSSITDHGSGDYTVNITTALSDINYTFIAFAKTSSGAQNRATFSNGDYGNTAPTSSTYRFYTSTLAGSPTDTEFVNVAIFR